MIFYLRPCSLFAGRTRALATTHLSPRPPTTCNWPWKLSMPFVCVLLRRSRRLVWQVQRVRLVLQRLTHDNEEIMARLSTHVLDTYSGRPAAAMQLTLERKRNPSWEAADDEWTHLMA